MTSSTQALINTTSAAERLNLSRQHLLSALQDITQSRSEEIRQRANRSNVWLDGLAAIPGGTVMVEALRIWWEKHPLHVASAVAADTAKAALKPIAERYPLRLVLAAFFVGGVFAWSRPWRWIFKPAVLMGFLPQLFSKVITQLPSQSWSMALTTLLQQLKPMPEVKASSNK